MTDLEEGYPFGLSLNQAAQLISWLMAADGICLTPDELLSASPDGDLFDFFVSFIAAENRLAAVGLAPRDREGMT
jgi:hypothetical protein